MSLVPYLPVEIVIMIFKRVTDKSTMKSVRLAATWARDECVDEARLFDKLRLYADRRHSWNRVIGMARYGLLKHVRHVVVCASSYAMAVRRDPRLGDKPYNDDLYPEPLDPDNKVRVNWRASAYYMRLGEPPVKIFWDDLEEAIPSTITGKARYREFVLIPQRQHDAYYKYVAFLTFCFRLLASENGNRGITIEAFTDLDDDIVLDAIMVETSCGPLHAPDHALDTDPYVRILWIKWFTSTFVLAVNDVVTNLRTREVDVEIERIIQSVGNLKELSINSAYAYNTGQHDPAGGPEFWIKRDFGTVVSPVDGRERGLCVFEWRRQTTRNEMDDDEDAEYREDPACSCAICAHIGHI